ncbi:ShlB/FhaC/HecB family hemolysin secretion/activation protein [Mixta tenebrionis]|uniref:ShlB/FhaC/HecB family hemolysin secretion/activation protein n=2 Tax=Mixta tenebrionis TaxID=2562439 RepID=A0A506V8F0_9GAMM|nr:ShlB/FhaC/HecB family hemolysin secretion/activation protein [Mixta tenebrionis]TPW41729.1 ShlB/FhaC/HecB family hemolysin secretion/activation protein [Mixta tenebrionis]
MSYRPLVFILLFLPTVSFSSSSVPEIKQQNIHQQAQEKARQKNLATSGKDVQGKESTLNNNDGEFSDTPGCLAIAEVKLEKLETVPRWLRLQRTANQSVGHCLNIANLRHLVSMLENRMMKAGYITSHVSVPEQQAGTGKLTLQIDAGRVGNIALTEGSSDYIHIGNTFPLGSGELLNLRALEQGLENMQRIPNTDVAIRLSPGDTPGTSNIDITRQQHKMWRTAFWLDDAGSRYTGRYQAGAAFYLDNPTSLNDLFYFSVGRTLEYKKERGSRNHAFWYSIPYGYWALNFYASENSYSQPLSDELADFYYHGESRNTSIELSRLLFRDARQKTTLSAQLTKRSYRYFLSDVELELQKKDLTNLRLALSHRRYLENSVLDATLSAQRNVSIAGNEPTAEMLYNGYRPDSRILQLDLQAWIPFQLGTLSLSYTPHYFLQYSPDKLISQDQFSIGNRWSVRGFDGEASLTGNSGWFLSNTVNLDLPRWQQQLYAGVDYGQIVNRADNSEAGKHMAGGVIGVRGELWSFGYDLFAGAPIYKPENFPTDRITLGFSAQWAW